jgi:hypothetical protein
VAPRLVVSFRGPVHPKTADASSHLPRAAVFFQRAEALGGRLCSFGAETFSFAFDVADVEEAVTLANAAAEEPVAEVERFGVGISQGELSSLAGVATSSLAWGRPLVMGVALARIALPGEVLLDPELPAFREGELLITGFRLSVDGGHRVRGARLDLVEPFRRDAINNVSRLTEPALVGCDGVFEQLAVPPGAMGLVRAERGAGGSRLLAEWTDRLAPQRVLLITPVGAAREPLGAARAALARSLAVHGTPALPSALRLVLGRVLAGEGADLWSVAELVDAWLGGAEDGAGVLAIDDASEVDTPTLEAVASALSVRGRFRLLTRLEVSAPLPDAFASIPMGPSLVIGPLARENAERLATAFTGGALSDAALTRWTRRGSSSPLALREALAEGIASGELAWAGEVAVPRRRVSGRGRSAGAHEWIARRFRRATPELRATLTALALLGGDAPDGMIDDLARTMFGPAARVSLHERALLTEGWSMRPEPGFLKLKSRTLGDAVVGLIDPTERRRWHAAASQTVENHRGLLSRAEAAHHAALAGDSPRAAELALVAARAAAAAALELASSTLVAFARAQDPELVARTLAPAEATPLVPPPPLLPFDEPTLSAGPPRSHAEDGAEEELSASDLLLLDEDSHGEPADSNLLTSQSPILSAQHLHEAAREALLAGDLTTLEAVLAELRAGGQRPQMVERLTALAALGGAGRNDALRRLAAAAGVVRPAAERARAQLAYAVGLASAGHTNESLLEGLGALASARRATDALGEQACQRFLARLSAATGHPNAAMSWLRGTSA